MSAAAKLGAAAVALGGAAIEAHGRGDHVQARIYARKAAEVLELARGLGWKADASAPIPHQGEKP